MPNCPHHIVQRGHNRNVVFVADEDYQFYLDNLREFKEKLDIKLYAWCLMTNHVHLILEPGDKASTVSELMKRLAGRQSAYVNKLERRTGSLWEGRFKASAIQRDQYLLACVRYVELNPVRAGMVAGPRQYKWSSYRERMRVTKMKMLDLDESFLGLGSNRETRTRRYKEYIRQGTSDRELDTLRGSLKRNQLTGNQRFVDEVESRIGIRVETRSRGRPRNEK